MIAVPSAVERFAATMQIVVPRLMRMVQAQQPDLPMSLAQIKAFAQLGEGARPSEIARRCQISSSATTAIIDSLVEDGYCERSHSTVDRREILVRPTPAGRAAAVATQTAISALVGRLVAGWDEERVVALTDLLLDLGDAIDRHLRPAGPVRPYSDRPGR